MKPDISYRSGRESDHGFIINSWLKSYYDTVSIYPRVSRRVFFKHEGEIVKGILLREYILVASDPKDHNHILGYCVYNPDPQTVHYIYMKANFRRFGIGKDLLGCTGLSRSEPITNTYWTPRFKRLKTFTDFNYNPYKRITKDDL